MYIHVHVDVLLYAMYMCKSFFFRLTVILNGYRSIREAFITQGTVFAGRPYPWVMKLVGVKEGKSQLTCTCVYA